MSRGRFIFGGVISGLAGALLAPLVRRAGRGAFGLTGASGRFAGTPCAAEERPAAEERCTDEASGEGGE